MRYVLDVAPLGDFADPRDKPDERVVRRHRVQLRVRAAGAPGCAGGDLRGPVRERVRAAAAVTARCRGAALRTADHPSCWGRLPRGGRYPSPCVKRRYAAPRQR